MQVGIFGEYIRQHNAVTHLVIDNSFWDLEFRLHSTRYQSLVTYPSESVNT
jgi:hypothetical protein